MTGGSLSTRRPAASQLTSEAFDWQLDYEPDDSFNSGGRGWSDSGGRSGITFANVLPAQPAATAAAANARSISDDGGAAIGGGRDSGSGGGGESGSGSCEGGSVRKGRGEFTFANALPMHPSRTPTSAISQPPVLRSYDAQPPPDHGDVVNCGGVGSGSGIDPTTGGRASRRSCSDDGGAADVMGVGGGRTRSANALAKQPGQIAPPGGAVRDESSANLGVDIAGSGGGGGGGGSGVPGFDEQLNEWLSGGARRLSSLSPPRLPACMPPTTDGRTRQAAGVEGDSDGGGKSGAGRAGSGFEDTRDGSMGGRLGSAESDSACSAVQKFCRTVEAIEDEHSLFSS